MLLEHCSIAHSMFIVAKTHVNAIYANLLNSRDFFFFFSKLNNSQMTLLETLIFTQIGSVGARDVPFHYETICTSQHKMARQNITLPTKAFKETPYIYISATESPPDLSPITLSFEN